MLLDKPIALNDVVVLKLVTQEEIVAKLVDIDSNKLGIHRPMLLSVGMDERTMKPGIQILPFFLLGAESDVKITIDTQHIIAKAPASADMKKNYLSATSSIAIPKSGLIT